MMFHASKLVGTLATALALGALATPGALAEPIVTQDLRSPDARDMTTPPRGAQDLRSPDTGDFAQGRRIVASTPVRVVEPAHRADPGFDWGDAVIGAGGALGVTLAAVGGTVALTRRRHPPAASQPARLIG